MTDPKWAMNSEVTGDAPVSKLPWKWGVETVLARHRFVHIRDAEGYLIGELTWSDDEATKPNAEYLCNCANTHAALVSALEKAEVALKHVEFCEEYTVGETTAGNFCPLCDQNSENGHTPDCLLDIMEQLQAALAAAKGEK